MGKSSFVWNLSGLRAPGSFDKDVEKGVEYAKSTDSIVAGGLCSANHNHNNNNNNNNNGNGNGNGSSSAANTANTASVSKKKSKDSKERESAEGLLLNPFYVYVLAVPFQFASAWLAKHKDSVDLFVLMYQSGDADSLQQVLELEQLLHLQAPRLFIGSKVDVVDPQNPLTAKAEVTDLP